MNALKTYDFKQLVDIYYPTEEADEFMGNLHKGDFAKAVCGDANKFVDPSNMSPEQEEKARKYFEEKCREWLMAPA